LGGDYCCSRGTAQACNTAARFINTRRDRASAAIFYLTGQNIDQWIDARAAESDIYLIRETGTEAVFGLMFLTPPFNNDIHLGYLLGRSTWGQGYASELLAGLVSHVPKTGFRLLGGVGRENPASAHVLRKTGFHVVPELSDAETEMFGITLNEKGPI
jgi:RimJ/RimL family protein N-acetyltransferase